MTTRPFPHSIGGHMTSPDLAASWNRFDRMINQYIDYDLEVLLRNPAQRNMSLSELKNYPELAKHWDHIRLNVGMLYGTPAYKQVVLSLKKADPETALIPGTLAYYLFAGIRCLDNDPERTIQPDIACYSPGSLDVHTPSALEPVYSVRKQLTTPVVNPTLNIADPRLPSSATNVITPAVLSSTGAVTNPFSTVATWSPWIWVGIGLAIFAIIAIIILIVVMARRRPS